MKLPDIKMLVKQDRAEFKRYKNGELWYFIPFTEPLETDLQGNPWPKGMTVGVWSGFDFPIPISDVEGTTLNDEEKPLLLMRWIRKHLERLKEENE